MAGHLQAYSLLQQVATASQELQSSQQLVWEQLTGCLTASMS
jgi:hypothetical protein